MQLLFLTVILLKISLIHCSPFGQLLIYYQEHEIGKAHNP